MRFIDIQWVSSPRFYHSVITADRITRLAGRALPPLAIIGSLVSGLWILGVHDPASAVSHSSLRGFHLIFGMIILGEGVHRLWRMSASLFRLGHDPQSWLKALKASLMERGKVLDWAYWSLYGAMALTGVARVFQERYGLSVSMLTPGFGWGVAHVLVMKFFLAVLLLRVFLLGTARSAWLLDYLRRP